MRKLILVLFGFCYFLGSYYGPAEGSDLEAGFEGIEWGASITSLPEFKPVGRKDKVVYYQDSYRIYELDGVPVERIIFGFYDTSFFAAYIDIYNPELFVKIRKRFIDKFGEYKITLSAKNNLTVYKWKYKGIKIKLKQWGSSGKMKVAFYYMPLSEKINEGDQEGFQERSIHLVPIEKEKRPERWTIFKW